MRFVWVARHKVLHSAPKTVPDGWKVWGLVDSPLSNGIGRFIPQLKRLTFAFSKDREDSAGAREFLLNQLPAWAAAHPSTAVYALPLRRSAPKLIAEYLNGRTATLHIGSLEPLEVLRFLNYAASRSGNRIAHFETLGKSSFPSVQGPWNPFTHRPTHLNVASFPHLPDSLFQPSKPSATQQAQFIAEPSSS